jgi:saccharopine dehydrogenase-like NADP-dependent oxidoreductase
MAKKFAVLGCGRVGATLARDLASDLTHDVSVFDASDDNLRQLKQSATVKVERADLSNAQAIRSLIEPFDVVAGALPSRLGFAAMRAIIEAGKPYADISFMVEDPREMDELARQRGATVVYDCGVAPGLANICIGRSCAEMDELHDVRYYVGGLPKRREWPFEYKAPFAPLDVIEEYTRPARMIEGGKLVTKPALSEPELMTLPQAGELEGFNTDGLRSLLDTIPAKNMGEKTLRYPGHAALMRAFRETGLFDETPMRVGESTVRPLDVTARLLTEKWRLEPDEPEFTVLRVVVEGAQNGKRVRHQYDLYDETDGGGGVTSMARTTAYPCASAARMLADGAFSEPGVHPPEVLGMRDDVYRRLIDDLNKRRVAIHRVTD